MSTGSWEKGRKSENFHVGLKVCGGFASSGFLWASSPDSARSPPQSDPRLSPLWRLGEPVFPVHLCTWREPAAKALKTKLCPWRWGPWTRESAPMRCSWPVSPAKLGRNLFSETKTSHSRPGLVLFFGALVYTAHPSGALWPISQHLWGSHRVPCSEGSSSAPPFPVLHEQGSSSLCSVSHQRYWDREVLRAKKDAREPSLMKAIVKCYWKFYFVLGLLTFLEVKAFPYCALLLSVCR